MNKLNIYNRPVVLVLTIIWQKKRGIKPFVNRTPVDGLSALILGVLRVVSEIIFWNVNDDHSCIW